MIEVHAAARQTNHTGERKMHAVSIGRPAAASTLVVSLWIVQALLAALFLFAGGAKLVMPIEAMTQGPIALPGVFLRFIGVCEVLGALGLILPGLLRIRTELTHLAAAGLAVIMLGAVMFTPPEDLVFASIPTAVGLLAATVAYCRWRLAKGY
jgi:DoxX-like family